MKVNKAYKFRIYPNKSQIKYIEGCFNACRYVYNVSLDCENQLYSLKKQFTDAKKTKEELIKFNSNLSSFGLGYHLKYFKVSSPWLKVYDAHALGYEMENLANAFKKFFSGGGYPKFKKKHDSKQSFRTRQAIQITDEGIVIPKLKTLIHTVFHREIEGKEKQMTISRECGKYFVSIMTEFEKEIPVVEIKNEVGLDMGITHFVISSEGKKIDNPRFYNSSREHLTVLQRNLAKAKKGSNNHKKLKEKIAKLHNKVKNKRNLFLHEVANEVIKENERIYVEDLNIKGMSSSAKGTIENPGKNVKQKSGLNRSILDTGWGRFIDIMKYKAKWEGKEVVKIKRFFASSKSCSNCGRKNETLTLNDRFWTCVECETIHDRDINAAKNIKQSGRRTLIEKTKKVL